MSITITFGPDGVVFGGIGARSIREAKGKSLIAFPADYTVIDLETTGFDPCFDEIIEVAALRIRNGEVVESFSSLVKPENEIDEYITQLTGITNEMVATAPTPAEIFPSYRNFLGDDILVGHNVNFDINFLYDNFDTVLGAPLTNDYIDTLRISRKALPDLMHHRLEDVSAALGVSSNGAHRALADCQTTVDCFCKLQEHIAAGGSLDEFIGSFKKHHSGSKLDLRTLTAEGDAIDETHILYGKHCVFTGALEKMTRAEAAQLVVNIGGICDNGITKKTNYLILGNNDYCKSIKDGKSSKQKKAEEYKLSGIDIEIIPENVFYDMIESI